MTSAAAFALLRYLETVPMFLPPAAVPTAGRPVPASSPAAVERDRSSALVPVPRAGALSRPSLRETSSDKALAPSGEQGQLDKETT